MKKKEKQDQFNPLNERIKYKYRIHIKRAFKKDEKTMFAELKYLREYELFSFFAGFVHRANSPQTAPEIHQTVSSRAASNWREVKHGSSSEERL